MKNRLKLISVVSIIVIVITYVLCALPGQFISQVGKPDVGASLAGYEYIFHCILTSKESQILWATGRPSVTGIMALIFMFLALGSYIFNKKSTALPLLGGILLTLSGFFFLMTTPFACLIYPSLISFVRAMWVPYLTGGLMALCGILSIYLSIVELKKEKVSLASKGGYSYLKK